MHSLEERRQHILEECNSLGLLGLQMPYLSTNTYYVVSLGGCPSKC